MASFKKAFTLVELIVVVTIIAVLWTIGTIAYTNGASDMRDAVRITQITELHNWLTSYSLNKILPDPAEKLDILADGKIIWYQWDLWKNLINTINFSGDALDTKTWDFFTVLMNKTKNKFQILSYLENQLESQTQLSFLDTTHANTQFDFPYSYGSKLGIIMDENNQVIHKNADFAQEGNFDTSSQNIPVKIQYSQNDSFEWNMQELNFYASNLTIWWVNASSCKEIKQKLKSAANTNGEYLIEFWEGNLQVVECNMTDNWGGWTRYAEIINEFSFALAEECYNSDWVVETDGFYCFNPHRQMVDADDLMVQINQDYASATAWDQYIMDVSSNFVWLSPVVDSWKTRSCSAKNNYFTPMDRAWSSYDWNADYYRLGYSFCNSSREPGWTSNANNVMNFSNAWNWPTWWNWVTKARNNTVVPFTFYYR